jgi:hypothetical protein
MQRRRRWGSWRGGWLRNPAGWWWRPGVPGDELAGSPRLKVEGLREDEVRGYRGHSGLAERAGPAVIRCAGRRDRGET